MKPLILHILNALWNDEAAFKRWLFGVAGFVVTLAGMVFVDGFGAALAWTGKQWAERIVGALIALVFSMVNPTGKLPKKPEVAP